MQGYAVKRMCMKTIICVVSGRLLNDKNYLHRLHGTWQRIFHLGRNSHYGPLNAYRTGNWSIQCFWNVQCVEKMCSALQRRTHLHVPRNLWKRHTLYISLNFIPPTTVIVSIGLHHELWLAMYNLNYCGAWWPIGRVNAFCQKGHEFDSRSSRHVGTLGKSFTHSGLWCFGVTQYQCCAGSASE